MKLLEAPDSPELLNTTWTDHFSHHPPNIMQNDEITQLQKPSKIPSS
jgi:hypothetical protein